MDACVHLPHRWRLIPAAETFSPLAKPPKFALVEQYVRVPAAKMRVAHTFEVVQKAKLEAVIYQGGIYPVCLCVVYRRSDPEPWAYLRLRGGVGVLLRLLVSLEALRLGSWGGACRRRGCFQCLAAGRYRWRLGAVWEYKPLGGRPVQDKSSLSREPSAVS